MYHRATHRPPPGGCRTRHTCGDLDAVCCQVVHRMRMLEIGETVISRYGVLSKTTLGGVRAWVMLSSVRCSDLSRGMREDAAVMCK